MGYLICNKCKNYYELQKGESKSNPRSHFMREALVEYIERKEKNNTDHGKV